MARYVDIECDAVTEVLPRRAFKTRQDIQDFLDNILTVDVTPVRHGRWVDRIVDENEVIQPWMKRYYCSECLEGGNQSWFKFCPNCGAKMDGGANNG